MYIEKGVCDEGKINDTQNITNTTVQEIQYFTISFTEMSADMSPTPRTVRMVGELRAKWSEEEEKMMIEMMVQEVQEGHRAQSGFKPRSLTRVQEALQANFQVTYSIQQIRNKCSQAS